MKKIFEVKTIVAIWLACAVLSGTALAQNTVTVSLKDGMKITMESTSYPSIFTIEPTLATLKEKEQKKAVEAFKAKLADGTLKPTVATMTTSIAGMTATTDGIIWQSVFGDYKFQNSAVGNKYYFYRQQKPALAESGGKVQMIYYQDVQTYPLVAKVGDELTPVVDQMLFPGGSKEWTDVGKVKTYTETTYHYDSRGVPVYKTVTDYYKTVLIPNKLTLSSGMTTISSKQVVAEESVTIGAKTYPAYKIAVRTENLGKMDITTDYGTNMTKFAAKVTENRINKAVAKATEAMLVTTGFEWFVPELCLVAKSEINDAFGNPIATVKTLKVE